ncbi:hypothetical protein TPHA_0N01970 [Tetrapisispora phaffii CBS 4417]|uniref:Uncharacterized protein n=1 Tax=Tetrapisispora phaffii (strain ATCC 24235 / CBS 4417 / NBRC 1672 / NRRL Y-8282 / UCD 70-5) TaxID=1071381 RepID=G8C1F0_TETPH|nr:hypothetical protein TPHA_0N01970 [Tetrapisispora phaffii CBS 4417]CCE65978.1 hypothetical protein TPHA_0N01970 [Tetrapisispora phaffii CBS 4417]
MQKSNGSFKQVGYAIKDLYVLGTLPRPQVDVSQYSFVAADKLLPTIKPGLSHQSLTHARLGHPSVGLYNRLASIIEEPRINENTFTLCPTCSLSKATMYKGKSSTTKYDHVLELIQVDLCGGFRYNGYEDHKYFMTIHDAASRYYNVIHLKSKSDAADELIVGSPKLRTSFYTEV